MLKTLLEQWKANQEQKRAIAAERWEQEKRWREEDRTVKLQKEAEKEQLRLEKEKEKAAERERSEEIYRTLYRAHLDAVRKAATVSYVALTCHEDTWTFLARRAFGMWSPEWTTSVPQEEAGQGGPVRKEGEFTKDPNLTEGRITKHADGMQTVEVSGDNLVTILEELFKGAWGPQADYERMLGVTNRSSCEPLHSRISQWLLDIDSSTVDKPGLALQLDHRISSSGHAG